MGQKSYTPEELNRLLMEMESRHRRNILLCIHEVLNALDTTKPDEERSRSAMSCMQLASGVRSPVGVLLSHELLAARLFCQEAP